MPRTPAAARPCPDAAYAQWVGACTNAGWHGVPAAEQVPVQDGLGRVTAAPVRGLPAGELLIPPGHRLRPADLAAAAAAGRATLEVARRPVTAIIPTGDEIRPVGTALRPGELIDTNSLMLALWAREAGAEAIVSDVQPDDPGTIAAEIRRTALAADLVLLIAGSSAGRRDYAAAAIAETGGLAVRGVAVRPGHPALLGFARPGRGRAGQLVPAVPVIGIPGYPLSAAVIFALFAVPLLAVLQGWKPPGRVWQQAQLDRDWTSAPDVEEWVPVTLAPAPAAEHASCVMVATPGRRGAGSISRLMRAHAWWRIPVGQAKFARGEYIDVEPIPGAPVLMTARASPGDRQAAAG